MALVNVISLSVFKKNIGLQNLKKTQPVDNYWSCGNPRFTTVVSGSHLGKPQCAAMLF